MCKKVSQFPAVKRLSGNKMSTFILMEYLEHIKFLEVSI
jgi:hypothetical protein